MANQKNSSEESEKASSGSAAFVKVCMDGAPYLRKVDLKMYKSYQELSDALAKMFSSFTMGKYTVSFIIRRKKKTHISNSTKFKKIHITHLILSITHSKTYPLCLK